MPRKDPEENEDSKKELEQEGKPVDPEIVEVEINLTLINNKLNYIIAKLDSLTTPKK